MRRTKVLLIDDEPPVLHALTRLLRREGYDLLTASDAGQALETLAHTEVGVVVCDFRLVGTTGAEVLAESLTLRPHAVRILLTASYEVSTAQAAINRGRISYFLLKPWDDDHLRAVLREAVSHYEMMHELRQLHELTRRQRDELAEWNRRLGDKVQERTTALQAAYEETLTSLVLALDRREHATAGHSRRAALYCLFLAEDVGIPSSELENLYRGALLHDLGKIGVPDAVLLKPGPLNAPERKLVEQHVVIGSELLEQIAYLRPAIAIPRYHHEWYDGTGYCAGLAGEAIPLPARVFAVIDVYDALRSRRPYKGPISHRRACELIAGEAGTHFDPAIAQAFLSTPARLWRMLASASRTTESYREALTACQAVHGRLGVSRRRGTGPGQKPLEHGDVLAVGRGHLPG